MEDLDYGFLDFPPFILRPYLQLLVFTVGIKLVTSDKVFQGAQDIMDVTVFKKSHI